MQSTSIVIVMIGLCVAGVAGADNPTQPRYTRKQNVALDVKLSDRVKPIQPTVTKARPLTSTEAMRIEDRKVGLRIDQERILEELVRDTPDSDPDKPDLLFRLAEHYAKSLRYWQMKSIEAQIERDNAPRR